MSKQSVAGEVVSVEKGSQLRFLNLTLHGRNHDPVVAFESHRSGLCRRHRRQAHDRQPPDPDRYSTAHVTP